MSAVPQLPSGTRLLHVGPHKTGSSAIQGALHTARERLAARDIIYPGRGRQTLWPILAVTGQPPLRGEPTPDIAWWARLATDIRSAGDRKVVLSSEFFSESDDATAARVVADLGPGVHVVVTLRSLGRILPSQWQQYIQNGYRFRYEQWLEGILSDPPCTPTPGFWRRHRHDELVSRWAGVVGAPNVTVVVLDETNRLMLLRTFEAMLGLPDGFLTPAPGAANRSLSRSEAELVLQLNEEFSGRKWPDPSYARFMRYGVIEQLKTARRPDAGRTQIDGAPFATFPPRDDDGGTRFARGTRVEPPARGPHRPLPPRPGRRPGPPRSVPRWPGRSRRWAYVSWATSRPSPIPR